MKNLVEHNPEIDKTGTEITDASCIAVIVTKRKTITHSYLLPSYV